MARDHIFSNRTPTDPLFRWRGGDVSRLEGLSDAAFAFMLTMLVVNTFDKIVIQSDLENNIRQLPMLAACFAIAIMIWKCHHEFFRRYGMEDLWIITLNSVLLLVVMAYVYMLRFLFHLGISHQLMGVEYEARSSLPPGLETIELDSAYLMQVFGIGFALIFGLLALMVLHAYRQRRRLKLDEVEIYLTKASIRSHLTTAGTGALSVVLATALPWVGVPLRIAMPCAGLVYLINVPMHLLHRSRVARRARSIASA